MKNEYCEIYGHDWREHSETHGTVCLVKICSQCGKKVEEPVNEYLEEAFIV